MLVADADVPDPVVKSLQAVKYGIVRYSELGLPPRPDKRLMAGILDQKPVGVLVTRDIGIPSQAYLFEYAQNGLTVVQLRWKQSNPKVWQEMAQAILRDGEAWEKTAAQTPAVISVNRHGSRIRLWSTIPASITQQAWAKLQQNT